MSDTFGFSNRRPVSIRSRIGLAKVPLCLLIGCSTLFGHILADPVIVSRTILTGVGIFILATGAATLNSLQEFRLDGELARTSDRPLPKGLLQPIQAGIQSLILLLFGFLTILFATKNFLPFAAAAFAVALYNGIYTPLKKKSVLAIIPGAICGALPPYIGWLAGGGSALGYPAALLIVLFILWQIPHFWLVLLTFQDDYRGSSLPSLLKQFREDSLKRFLVTWIGALVLVMLMYLTLPPPLSWVFRIITVMNGCLLLAVFTYSLAIRSSCNYRNLFIVLNVSLFLHMLIIAAGRLVS
jgi:protoheme IX farnesyltransferase